MDTQLKEAAQLQLDKAVALGYINPKAEFLINVQLRLRQIITEDVETAATSGLEIMYNPNFLLELSVPEVLFLILHEIKHVTDLHYTTRMEQGFEPKKWNHACDYYINYELVKEGFQMPEIGLYSAKFANMAPEEIYPLLPDIKSYPDLGADIEGDSELTEEEKEELNTIISNAYSESSVPGKSGVPSAIVKRIEELKKPQVPLKQKLNRFATRYIRDGMDYNRPNRRYFPKFFMPSSRSKIIDHFVIAMDMSASVNDDEIHRYLSEIHHGLKGIKAKKITIIQFSHQIDAVDEVKGIQDIIKLDLVGRGGTELFELFEWLSQNSPDLAVIFSDGDFYIPHNLTDYSNGLVWVIHNNPAFYCTKGTILHHELRD